MKSMLLLLAVSAQAIYSLPPPHPAVVTVRQEEELLPPHLRKPALRNPHLREILTLTSVLHHGEQPVYQREADEIPRSEIYNILTHAGLIGRRRPHQPHHEAQHSPPVHFNEGHQHFDLPFLSSADLLQYL